MKNGTGYLEKKDEEWQMVSSVFFCPGVCFKAKGKQQLPLVRL